MKKLIGYVAGMVIYVVTLVKMTWYFGIRFIPMLNYERAEGMKVGMSVSDGIVAVLVQVKSGRDVELKISPESAREVASQMIMAADAMTLDV